MLPRPTPLAEPDRDVERRRTGRLVSALVVAALLAGVPGLATAQPATAAPSLATAAPATAAVTGTAPAAVSLSVVAGPTSGGTTVDLSGTGVGATTTAWFGSTAVTRITKVSSTRVRVLTPAHPAGVVERPRHHPGRHVSRLVALELRLRRGPDRDGAVVPHRHDGRRHAW